MKRDLRGDLCKHLRLPQSSTQSRLLMREIRYLDKLVDELARGKAMETILRG
jgi:hypothetical protein